MPRQRRHGGIFSHLKEEWFRIQKPGTLDEFHAGLTDCLRWWNTTRIQQRLGYLSPGEYRAQTSAIAYGLIKTSNFRGPVHHSANTSRAVPIWQCTASTNSWPSRSSTIDPEIARLGHPCRAPECLTGSLVTTSVATIAGIQARDGKVYCCAILDCFSKMIVGRSFSTTAETALVNNAVNMAAQEWIRWKATILQADHGPQFTSWGFGENLRRWGLLEPFGTVVDCFDNAVMKAFWGVQTELLNTKIVVDHAGTDCSHRRSHRQFSQRRTAPQLSRQG